MIYGLVVAAGVVLAGAEQGWPQWLYWRGERPELLVVMVVLAGLYGGPGMALVAGFCAALFRAPVEHLAWGGPFVGYLGLGAVVGEFGHRVLAPRALSTALASAVGVGILRVAMGIVQPPPAFWPWVWGIAAAAVYTALAAVPMHWIVAAIARRVMTGAVRPVA